jgi:DNA-binding CsgD family transcriptional regulator
MLGMTHTDDAFEGRRVRCFEDELPPPPFEDILANLDGPMLVIDRNLRIRNANPNALRILRCGREDGDFGRYLVGETEIRSQALRRQARAAVMAGARAILMLGRQGGERLICSLKGLQQPQAGVFGLVALQPLCQASSGIAPFLREMYGLSNAEAQIALAASNGLEVSQIVLERNISIHTLRAQIASIKAKMGVSRMTEVAIAITEIRMTAALM